MLITLVLVIIFVACCVALITAAGFVIHGTVTKNQLGINPDPSQCPRCHTAMPSVRVPKSFKQAMWGGGTCPNCGCEVDKWGREI
ncbi:MAG TPA: hypothetical protein VK699_05180 [Terriglobales bacterium]|nr:hypothetical protein [Terriglobales bacterium]